MRLFLKNIFFLPLTPHINNFPRLPQLIFLFVLFKILKNFQIIMLNLAIFLIKHHINFNLKDFFFQAA
jgi:hypothetical protein